MTLRPFTLGQEVLVRGTIGACQTYSAIVRIPMMKLDAEFPLEVPIGDIFLPASTELAADAARALLERADGMRALALRLQAEIREIGRPALAPPQR